MYRSSCIAYVSSLAQLAERATVNRKVIGSHTNKSMNQPTANQQINKSTRHSTNLQTVKPSNQ
jgi:hypothetical protein